MIAYFITQLFVSEQNKIAIDGRRKIACANFSSPLGNKKAAQK